MRVGCSSVLDYTRLTLTARYGARDLPPIMIDLYRVMAHTANNKENLCNHTTAKLATICRVDL